MPRLSLESTNFGDEIPDCICGGSGGRFRRPLDPSRAERRPRKIFCRLRRVGIGLRSSVEKQPCGVRTSHCAVCKCFPRIPTVQRRFAARTCRIRYARLLAASKPPLRRLLWRRRDSSTLPAHGRYRPVTCDFTSFPEKRSKTRKANPQVKKSISLSRHL